MSTSANSPQIRLDRRSPAYWRVTFDHPPSNIFGPETIPQLGAVINALESGPDVKVVVFDSGRRIFSDPLQCRSLKKVGGLLRGLAGSTGAPGRNRTSTPCGTRF